MNIKKLVEGEWMEFEPEDERIGQLRLRVRPMGLDIAAWDLTGPAQMVKVLSELVIDWNLDADGEKIECTPETRATYLPSIYLIKTKNGGFVGNEVLAFCQNIGNFLKN